MLLLEADTVRKGNEMFNITIDTDNSAFDNNYRGPELARILRNLADELEGMGAEGGEWRFHDANGNACGNATLDHRDDGE
jgi:hypothetical protein